jgi:hypothetical protein
MSEDDLSNDILRGKRLLCVLFQKEQIDLGAQACILSEYLATVIVQANNPEKCLTDCIEATKFSLRTLLKDPLVQAIQRELKQREAEALAALDAKVAEALAKAQGKAP